MTDAVPPRLANRLLDLVMSSRSKEMLVGDLTEEFHLLASTHPRRASRWYWSQVIRSVAPLLAAHVRSGLWLKTMGAALLGYMAVAVIVMSSDAAMSPLMKYGVQIYSAISLAVAWPAMMLGGYVAARLRPRAAIALACLACVMGVLSLAVTGDAAPRWYQVALIIVGPAAALVGGRLGRSRAAVRINAA